MEGTQRDPDFGLSSNQLKVERERPPEGVGPHQYNLEPLTRQYHLQGEEREENVGGEVGEGGEGERK